MYKTIKLKGYSADAYTDLIARIKFSITSDTEVKVLQLLLKYSSNMTITMTKQVNKVIADESLITTNLLSTTLHRLEKKESIRRQGRTIYLNLAFKDLETIKGIVFTLNQETQTEKG